MAREDNVGEKYGDWTVLSLEKIGTTSHPKWLCECKCGTKKPVFIHSLKRGSSRSCGCNRAQIMREQFCTHGMTGTQTYGTWEKTKNRCNNKNHDQYAHYGGRGISICERWSDFENFLSDMGERPDGMSLDRIDNNGNYEPGNCRWVTQKEQNRNKRNSRILKFNNEERCMAEWAEILGISNKTIYERLKRGWSVEKALTTKPLERGRN